MRQITQILSEQQRRGKRYRPNPNNPVTANRRKINKQLWNQVAENGGKIEMAALEVVRQHEPQIRRYVSRRGEVPLGNPVELSVQAAALATKEAQQVATDLGVNMETAQMIIDENESSSYEMNPVESDEFIGSILGAIGAVANRGITKIAEKKKAKGKPAKFWTFLADMTKPKEPVLSEQVYQQENPLKGIGVAVKDIFNDIKDNERKKEINKMIPVFIIAAVVIILVTFLIAKKK